ncbi:hypothetical protein [Gordonia insulae]|uniref:Uncharacterized protein n=1 Tax=Gordonia insulae TaxID=2420509 RepID=A0A3G8JFI3_9ACTN|nr:hypothetical protein [Gordonia insulae]AZG43764.1 hypothetical protein D7316_00333 [Gordonia insulae]
MTFGDTRFSFGKLVLFALGAGVLVLLVSIPIILLIARWSPIAGLVVALIAVLAMIAAIGTVSRRMIATAEREILAARAAEDAARSHDPRPRVIDPQTVEPTDRNSSTDG